MGSLCPIENCHLFYPFLTFGYIWGQIPIDCHMRIYKLCKHAKNCTHKWYFYGYFHFLQFCSFFPFSKCFLFVSYCFLYFYTPPRCNSPPLSKATCFSTYFLSCFYACCFIIIPSFFVIIHLFNQLSFIFIMINLLF